MFRDMGLDEARSLFTLPEFSEATPTPEESAQTTFFIRLDNCTYEIQKTEDA
jgi:hypothetical protein